MVVMMMMLMIVYGSDDDGCSSDTADRAIDHLYTVTSTVTYILLDQ